MTPIPRDRQNKLTNTICDMERKYFVTYGFIPEGSFGYILNSMEISTLEMHVKDMSPGQLAEYLEREVSDTIDLPSVVIINYWEM